MPLQKMALLWIPADQTIENTDTDRQIKRKMFRTQEICKVMEDRLNNKLKFTLNIKEENCIDWSI